MPEERVGNEIEVVNLVPLIILQSKYGVLALLYRGMVHRLHKVYCVCDVQLAEVHETVLALELLDGLSHRFDVVVVLSEEVFVGSLVARVTSVEGVIDLFTSYDPDVLGEHRVDHLHVIQILFLGLLFWRIGLCWGLFGDIGSEMERDNIPVCTHSFICPCCPRIPLIRLIILHQTQPIQTLI